MKLLKWLRDNMLLLALAGVLSVGTWVSVDTNVYQHAVYERLELFLDGDNRVTLEDVKSIADRNREAIEAECNRE